MEQTVDCTFNEDFEGLLIEPLKLVGSSESSESSERMKKPVQNSGSERNTTLKRVHVNIFTRPLQKVSSRGARQRAESVMGGAAAERIALSIGKDNKKIKMS